MLKVFRSKDAAYRFEQRAIKAHLQNPKCLNVHCQTTREYTMLGRKRPDLALLNAELKTVPKKYKTYRCEHCKKKFSVLVSEHQHETRPRKLCSNQCKGASSKGRRYAYKPSNRLYGPAWNRGLHDPNGANNGCNGAKKQSQTVTGRKRKYRKDGSWFWIYPDSVYAKAA